MSIISSKEIYSDTLISHDVKSAGKGAVDLVSGALKFAFNDITFNFGNPKISISHCYDSAQATEQTRTYEGETIFDYKNYGNGWKLNIDCRVWQSADSKKLYYVDADGRLNVLYRYRGNIGYLLRRGITSTFIYVSKDNPTGGFYFDGTGRFVKYDESDNFEYYSQIGDDSFRLTSITNSDEKTLTIEYSGTKISRIITDRYWDCERSVDFVYNSAGLLTRISDSAGRVQNYIYDANNNLTLAYGNSASGGYAVFTYDSNKRITSAKSDIDYKVEYKYNSGGKITSISEYSYYSEISSKGTVPKTNGYEFLGKTEFDYNSIDYDARITRVTSKTGINTIYQFEESSADNGFYCNFNYESASKNQLYIPKNVIYYRNGIYNVSKFNMSGNLLSNCCFERINSSHGNVADWNVIDGRHIPQGNAKQYQSHSYVINGACSFLMDGTQSDNNSTTLQQLFSTLPKSGYYTFYAWLYIEEYVNNGETFSINFKFDTGSNGYIDRFGGSYALNRGGWHLVCFNVNLEVPADTNRFIFELTAAHNKFKLYLNSVYLAKSDDEEAKEVWGEPNIITFDSAGKNQAVHKFSDIKSDYFMNFPDWLKKKTVENFIEIMTSYRDIDISNIKLKISGTDYPLKYCEIVPCGIIVEKNIYATVKNEIDGNKRFVTQSYYNNGTESAFSTAKEYDGKGRLIRSKDYRGTVQETKYKGNEIMSLTYKEGNENSAKRYITRTELSVDKGAVKTVYDENGGVTQYVYKLQPNYTEFTDDKLYNTVVPNGAEYKTSYNAEDLPKSLAVSGEQIEYVYRLNLPVTVKVNDSDIYEFTYDGCGNIIKVEQNGKVLSETEYYQKADYSTVDSRNYIKTKTASGTVVTYLDEYGRESSTCKINDYGYNETLSSSNYDSAKGYLKYYTDRKNSSYVTWDFNYSNVANETVSASGGGISYKKVTDSHDGATRKIEVTLNTDCKITTDCVYEEYYGRGEYPDKRIKESCINNGFDTLKSQFLYDDLNRNYKTVFIVGNKIIANEEFDYNDWLSSQEFGNSSKSTTNGMMLSCADSSIGEMFYYDKNGNLKRITRMAEENNRYMYDELDRLIREDNKDFGKTYLYEYDNKNNVIYKAEIPFTLDEEIFCYYVKEHELFAGNDVFCGEVFCDENFIGNPADGYLRVHNGESYKDFPKLTYDKNNVPLTGYNSDGYMVKNGDAAYEWKDGKLSKVTKGTRVLQYTYDSRGYRTKWTDGNATGNYFYDENGDLLYEKQNLGDMEVQIYYLYEPNGVRGFTLRSKVGETENGGTFYYLKDMQNNIRFIVDSQGNKVVEYNYTAWGDTKAELSDYSKDGITAEMVYEANPFTYRGYYYDRTLDMYYLKSRYYDYKQCRFISPDNVAYLDPQTIGGMNLYAYCLNNPVMGYDPEGTSWSSFWNGVGDWFKSAGAWINDNIVQPVKENWDIILGGAAIAGAVIASIKFLPSKIIDVTCGAIFGGISGMFTSFINGESMLQGLASGALIGGLGSIRGFAGAFAAFGSSLINDRFNGKKAGWDSFGRALVAGVTAGFFSALGNDVSSKFISGNDELYARIISNCLYSSIFSAHNWFTDSFIKFIRG